MKYFEKVEIIYEEMLVNLKKICMKGKNELCLINMERINHRKVGKKILYYCMEIIMKNG